MIFISVSGIYSRPWQKKKKKIILQTSKLVIFFTILEQWCAHLEFPVH